MLSGLQRPLPRRCGPDAGSDEPPVLHCPRHRLRQQGLPGQPGKRSYFSNGEGHFKPTNLPALLGDRGIRRSLVCFLWFQVAVCQASCPTLFSIAGELAICRQACTQYPGQLCEASCDTAFAPPSPQNTNCKAACRSLCFLGIDDVAFQSGVAAASLRSFCSARSVPVCLLSSGSGNVFGESLLISIDLTIYDSFFFLLAWPNDL